MKFQSYHEVPSRLLKTSVARVDNLRLRSCCCSILNIFLCVYVAREVAFNSVFTVGHVGVARLSPMRCPFARRVVLGVFLCRRLHYVTRERTLFFQFRKAYSIKEFWLLLAHVVQVILYRLPSTAAGTV